MVMERLENESLDLDVESASVRDHALIVLMILIRTGLLCNSAGLVQGAAQFPPRESTMVVVLYWGRLRSVSS